MTNQQLGRYIIKKRIGRGGMGEVFQAYDPDLNRDIALKTLTLPEPGQSGNWQRLFKQEVQAAARLSHPHIVIVHDVGLDHTPPFVVMELLNGGTLRQRFQAGTLSWQEALILLRLLAEALAFAHQAGIIHRDVKPGNVMFATEASDSLKLVDFGLVRLQDKDETSFTIAGSGTPGYMSPEQARGDVVDVRTDIFAMGIILLEAITGNNPLDKGSSVPTLIETVSDSPVDLSALVGVVPQSVAQLIEKAVAKQTEQRYPNWSYFLGDLHDCLADATDNSDTPSTTHVSPPPIIDLVLHEDQYRQRIKARFAEDAAYYIPLIGETAETVQTATSSVPRSARRRRQRARAEYHEWVQTGEELQRVKLNTLREGVDKYNCIILLGDPGSGKSTVLENLAYQFADEADKIPLLLRLNEFGVEFPINDFIIEDFIRHSWAGTEQAGHWQASELADNLTSYLEQGRMLLLFDALNEMPQAGYAQRAQVLRTFIDTWLDKGNRFVVTCRVLDYGEELTGLQRIEIQPLSDSQIETFLQNELPEAWSALWDALIEQVSATDKAYSTYANPPLLELARNPYMLTMMIDIFVEEGTLGQNRAALLTRFTQEIEWEKAARGTKKLRYPWGNAFESDRLNADEGHQITKTTTPVGIYPNGISEFGLFDCSGNVWEWCSTVWHDMSLTYQQDEWTIAYLVAPKRRVMRGGSWKTRMEFAQCDYRLGRSSSRYFSSLGFRLVSPSIVDG